MRDWYVSLINPGLDAPFNDSSHRCILLICSAPVAITIGRSIQITGSYRPQHYIGWAFCVAGFGLLSLLSSTSTLAQEECLQLVTAIGLGFLYIAPQFSVLAPLDVRDNASALALLSWCRQFGQ